MVHLIVTILFITWSAIGATSNIGNTRNRITDRFQGHMFDI